MTNYEGLQAAILAMATICGVLALVAVVLRVIGIHLRDRRLKAHDYLVIASVVCMIGYVIIWYIGVMHARVGKHILEMSPSDIVKTTKIYFASEFIWSTGVGAFRLSILFLYIELFPSRKFLMSAIATGGLVIAYWVASILTICLLCRPVAFNWDKTISGKCGNYTATELASAGFNMAIDFIVVLLPMPIVWRLQMSTKKKVGVSVTFALGLCISGINLGRLIQTLTCDDSDFLYCSAQAAILANWEMSAGVIVACVPTLGPVIFPHRFGSSAQRYRNLQHTYSSSNTKTPRSLDRILEAPWLRRLQREDIELGDELGTSHTTHSTSTRIGAPEPVLSTNNIGVRKDFGVVHELSQEHVAKPDATNDTTEAYSGENRP